MRLISSQRELREFRRRFRWIRTVVIVCFLILAGRFFQLQVMDGEKYKQESINNFVRVIDIPAMRGVIRDSQGRVVATNRPANSVFLTPHFFERPGTYEPDGAFDRLCGFLDFSRQQKEKMRERISSALGLKRYRPMLVSEDVSRRQLALIETYQDSLPGVDVIITPIRSYPYKQHAAHAIGYMNEVSAAELDGMTENSNNTEDYRSGDRIGRMGIERAYEKILRGRRGWRKLLVDARGVSLKQQEKRLAELGGEWRREPVPGKDITLTIDMELQRIVEAAFRGHPSGAAVVTDVNTGRVMAALSKPAYDPNLLTSGLTVEQNRELNENPFRPRIDKTLFENYFPGSTFKPFSAIAALEDGLVDPDEQIRCKGYLEFGRRTFKCSHTHGLVNLHDALVKSCNVYFFNLAEKTGMNRIARYASDFGFGIRTGIGYNSEVPGFIPTRSWYDEKFPGQFRIGFTLNAAIGQGNTKVTLMQLAAAYSAIANQGTLYKPMIVDRIESSDGEVIKSFSPEVRRRVHVRPEYLARLTDALVGVVSNQEGTAYDINDDSISIAGKTGTAQVARRRRRKGESMERYWYYNRDHAWFSAFAPATDPQISVVVMIEHGGHGGRFAAPIAAQIIKGYFRDISPGLELQQIAQKKSVAPGVTGKVGRVTTSIHPR